MRDIDRLALRILRFNREEIWGEAESRGLVVVVLNHGGVALRAGEHLR